MIADTQRYLDLLYPDVQQDAWIVVSGIVKGDFQSKWFRISAMPDVAAFLAKYGPRYDLYVGLGLHAPTVPQPPTDAGRVTRCMPLLACGLSWIIMLACMRLAICHRQRNC